MGRPKKTSLWPKGTDMNWANHLPGPMSALARQHKHREALREISADFEKAVANIDWERRRRCLSSPRDFIREYCMDAGGIFDYEPFSATDQIIDVMLKATSSDVPYHLRMTRGGGKTTLFIWLAAFLICRNAKSFIVLAAAKMAQAQPMVEDLGALFTSSEKLVQDFPEKCFPLVMLGGSMQRATSQRFLGKPTNCRLTKNIIRFPSLSSGCPLLAGSEGGAIVMANGFEGKTRGLRSGKRRPDFILLDDIQDDEMAKSGEQVEKAREKIYKTYLKLGKSVEKPAILMASTPIEPDDLSETIANDRNWKTQTFPLMLSMPDDSSVPLWKEYKRIQERDIDEVRMEEHNDTAYYLEHRGEMDAGAVPFWSECYDQKTEASAVQHAMNLFLADAPSFQSEYQMKPRRESAALILPRTEVLRKIYPGYVKGVIPPGFVLVVAATDINPSYALTTTVVAFKTDRTAHVLEHIISPIKVSVSAVNFDDMIYAALRLHGEALHNLNIPIKYWGVDASGQQSTAVQSFTASALATVRMNAAAMYGRASTRMNLFTKKRLRDAINETVDCGDPSGRKWIIWNADHYKEQVQRALLAPQLAPRGMSLYADADPSGRQDFATQVTNELLKWKRPSGDGREEYGWQSKDPHDYLDCLAMCYALAGRAGISGAVQVRRIAERRKPKVIIR